MERTLEAYTSCYIIQFNEEIVVVNYTQTLMDAQDEAITVEGQGRQQCTDVN